MKMKKKLTLGSTSRKNMNMVRGFMCSSKAATAVLCRTTTAVVPRPPPHHHHQPLTLGGGGITDTGKYMRLIQLPQRPTSDEMLSSSSSKLLFLDDKMVNCHQKIVTKNLNFQNGIPENARKLQVMPAASSALLSSSNTNVFQVVVMRVSLHCQGCASRVRKHLSKMEGVISFSIELENKKVMVMGNVSPAGVLESVSKIKKAEFWPS